LISLKIFIGNIFQSRGYLLSNKILMKYGSGRVTELAIYS